MDISVASPRCTGGIRRPLSTASTNCVNYSTKQRKPGGWSFEQDIVLSLAYDPNLEPGSRVTYCKQAGTQLFYASARSLNRLLTGPEGLLSVALNTGFMTTPCGHNDHPGQTPGPRQSRVR
jgi:hypothetical protein